MKITVIIAALLFSAITSYSQEVWNYLNFELPNYNYHGAIYPVNENEIHVVADDGYLYKSNNGGITWSEFDSQVREFFFDLRFFDANLGFAVGANGSALRSTNGGETWEIISPGTSEDLISVAFNSVNSIWMVGNNGIVLHSIDGGNNWTVNTSLTSEKLQSVSFKNESIGYISGNNGTLFYTDDGGSIWNPLSIPTTDDLFSISITPTSVFLLAGFANNFGDYFYEGNAVFNSQDNVNWAMEFPDLLPYGFSDIYVQDDSLAFGISSWALLNGFCYVEIDKTLDLGANWTESFYEEIDASNCNSNDGYADIEFINEEIGYVLLGNKILTTQELIVGIKEFDRNISFIAYPNPVTNGFINVQLITPDIENVAIDILDMTGKAVFSKANLESLTKIEIQYLKSGIYFVTLSEENILIESKKIVIQ